jgi:hypothetical protein
LTSPVYTTKFDDYCLLGCCSLSVLRAPSKAPSTHRTHLRYSGSIPQRRARNDSTARNDRRHRGG